MKLLSVIFAIILTSGTLSARGSGQDAIITVTTVDDKQGVSRLMPGFEILSTDPRHQAKSWTVGEPRADGFSEYRITLKDGRRIAYEYQYDGFVVYLKVTENLGLPVLVSYRTMSSLEDEQVEELAILRIEKPDRVYVLGASTPKANE